MITTAMLFGVWAVLALYFVAFFLVRKPRAWMSLVWASACTGWPFAAAREQRWLGTNSSIAVVVVGLAFGVLGLGIVFTYESQR